LAAIKENMGIASLPCFIADKEPGIRRIPHAEVVTGDWIWILAHKDMMTNARVRALMDFIANAFETHNNLLEGQVGGT
jgi:DNA-binding transcriptional LysR family regulator